MKLVIQRVIQSNLTIDKKTYSSIGYGMVIFIGISDDDNEFFLNKTASKVSKLRIFNDEFGKMNKNINDINGEISKSRYDSYIHIINDDNLKHR